SIAAVIFYIFFIWYRDWFGKNTFIYRLLMLPTTRLNIFYAKLSTILLVTFGFVGFQLMILPLETRLMQWMVPKDFRVDMTLQNIMDSFMEWHIILPQTFTQFILHYGTGTIVVSVIFTAILFERSFRWKGVLLGVIYGIVAIGMFISPLILQDVILDGFFYPGEMVLLEIAAGLLVLAGSIWMSNFLLKKKIRVYGGTNMQKYWKTISMMIVIVLGIGTFYIHKAVTASQYPDFIIETVSGDEAEIDNIVLQGSYKRDTIEEMVYITPDGSK